MTRNCFSHVFHFVRAFPPFPHRLLSSWIFSCIFLSHWIGFSMCIQRSKSPRKTNRFSLEIVLFLALASIYAPVRWGKKGWSLECREKTFQQEQNFLAGSIFLDSTEKGGKKMESLNDLKFNEFWHLKENREIWLEFKNKIKLEFMLRKYNFRKFFLGPNWRKIFFHSFSIRY